ncbi:MAG: hypothetical protein JWQ72_1225 [Polaromonas sp.]|nr:hypothetical protein [Polaromonas sp.]
MGSKAQYNLAFHSTVALQENRGDWLLTGHGGNAMRVAKLGNAVCSLLANLTAGGMTADQLCEAAAEQDGGADIARLYYVIAAFEKKGFVSYTLAVGAKKWVMLEAVSPAFCLQQALPDVQYRLSRFACLRRVDDAFLLESPLGHARVFLYHSHAAAALALLVTPRTASELAVELAGLGIPDATALLSLLCSAGATFVCNTQGGIPEDKSTPLQQWEFHDMLFHHRSRSGRHADPSGGTYRFLGTLPPLPVVKLPMSGRRIALAQPDMTALAAGDMPFSCVSESRQSIRNRGEQPIGVTEVGQFLYRSARVKRIEPADPARGAISETSWRVCPSGGAMHELELYLSISRCGGLAPGLYRYDPLGHALEHLSDLGAAQQAVIAAGSMAAGLSDPPDVLITLAARFQRVSWKYQSLAYALILKNVGALLQQMYLVATAMELAPCALGGGDADRFSEATGLDHYAETSVGEFLLSSRSSVDAY